MKKIILIVSFLMFGASLGLAMSSDKPANVTKQEQKTTTCVKNKDHHKLVDIYTKEDTTSQIVGKVTLETQDNYSIFYCKNTGWCEVVNKTDGNTGWVSLDQLKQAQQKYANYMQKKNMVKKLVEYVNVQDQKIAQLHAMIQQMQEQFGYVLQKQQVEVNQLRQAYYYQ